MTIEWDILGRPVDLNQKKKLVVVDFDNTCTILSLKCYKTNIPVFKTPVPNHMLWTKTAIGYIKSKSFFIEGGWYYHQCDTTDLLIGGVIRVYWRLPGGMRQVTKHMHGKDFGMKSWLRRQSVQSRIRISSPYLSPVAAPSLKTRS